MKSLLALVFVALTACAHTGVVDGDTYCAALQDNGQTWSAIGTAATFLGGAGGVAAIKFDEVETRAPLALIGLGFAGLGITALKMEADLESRYARECSLDTDQP